jgi:hypothetical protein
MVWLQLIACTYVHACFVELAALLVLMLLLLLLFVFNYWLCAGLPADLLKAYLLAHAACNCGSSWVCILVVQPVLELVWILSSAWRCHRLRQTT